MNFPRGENQKYVVRCVYFNAIGENSTLFSIPLIIVSEILIEIAEAPPVAALHQDCSGGDGRDGAVGMSMTSRRTSFRGLLFAARIVFERSTGPTSEK